MLVIMNDVDYYMEKIKEEFKDSNFEYIVGIGRGSLFLVQQIAYVLGISNIEVVTHERDKKGPAVKIIPEYSKILIVDDIVDTGKTMKQVVDLYKHLGCFPSTTTYCIRDTSIFKPDVTYKTVSEDDGYIKFFWERS